MNLWWKWCFFICMYEKDEECIMSVWMDYKPSARCCWASTLLPPVPPGTTVSPCLALSSSSCLFCWRLAMFLTLSHYAILSLTRFVLEAVWEEQRGLRVYIGSYAILMWDIVMFRCTCPCIVIRGKTQKLTTGKNGKQGVAMHWHVRHTRGYRRRKTRMHT